jgi:hypothetical protein
MVNCKLAEEYLIHLLGIIRMRREGIEKAWVARSMRRKLKGWGWGGKAENPERQAAEEFKRPRYKIAQRTRPEESMLCLGIGKLILLWVADAPQHPSGDVPRT